LGWGDKVVEISECLCGSEINYFLKVNMPELLTKAPEKAIQYHFITLVHKTNSAARD
jgi:hypothetical protein